MYKIKRILVLLKNQWLDYFLLILISFSLILAAHSFSIIVWEITEKKEPSLSKQEIILVQGKNFKNGPIEEEGDLKGKKSP